DRTERGHGSEGHRRADRAVDPVSGVVTVRRFELRDLDAAARFSDAARALDAYVEPFGQRLAVIATGSRAALDLWRVAAGEDQGLYGIAFSALRESAPGPLYDFYVAVHPSMRRQGLGRALSEPALSARARLRARVRDDAFAGRAFATALGFVETGAQLSLQWGGGKVEVPPMPALRIRAATRRDEPALRRLSNDARVHPAEANFARADQLAECVAAGGAGPTAASAAGGYVLDGTGHARGAAGGALLERATRTRRTRRSSRCTTVSSSPPM